MNDMEESKKCSVCNGKGFEAEPIFDKSGSSFQGYEQVTCQNCNGTGYNVLIYNL